MVLKVLCFALLACTLVQAAPKSKISASTAMDIAFKLNKAYSQAKALKAAHANPLKASESGNQTTTKSEIDHLTDGVEALQENMKSNNERANSETNPPQGDESPIKRAGRAIFYLLKLLPQFLIGAADTVNHAVAVTAPLMV